MQIHVGTAEPDWSIATADTSTDWPGWMFLDWLTPVQLTSLMLCWVWWNPCYRFLACWKGPVHLHICLMWSCTSPADHHREHFLSLQQSCLQRWVGLWDDQEIALSWVCERSIHFGRVDIAEERAAGLVRVHLHHILHHQTQLHCCIGIVLVLMMFELTSKYCAPGQKGGAIHIL